jgi:protein-S-isoprenylcysteine O-methyltransferase Ste14
LARLLGRPTSGPPLLLRGPYRFVRYPACSGLLAFSLGLLLWRPAWITAAVFLAALVGGKIWIALEERKCLARFGEAYRRYRAAVPALLPLRLRPRSLKADS